MSATNGQVRMLMDELASEWASRPTDMCMPRAYQNEAAEYSRGFLRELGNYLRTKAGTYLTLGMIGLAGAGAACGGKNPNPGGPSPTDMCPNITGDQPGLPPNMVKDGNGNCVCAPGYIDSNGSCPVQPRSSLSIASPLNDEKAATPLDVKYTFNDQTQRATHADFAIDGGEVYHDRSMGDGEFQMPEERVSAGRHRLARDLGDDNETKPKGRHNPTNF